jgi:hypothetical protein
LTCCATRVVRRVDNIRFLRVGHDLAQSVEPGCIEKRSVGNDAAVRVALHCRVVRAPLDASAHEARKAAAARRIGATDRKHCEK